MDAILGVAIAAMVVLAPTALVLVSGRVAGYRKALWALATLVPSIGSIALALVQLGKNPHDASALLLAPISWLVYIAFVNWHPGTPGQ